MTIYTSRKCIVGTSVYRSGPVEKQPLPDHAKFLRAARTIFGVAAVGTALFCSYELSQKIPPTYRALSATEINFRSATQNQMLVSHNDALCYDSLSERLAEEARSFDSIWKNGGSYLVRTLQPYAGRGERLAIRAEGLAGVYDQICSFPTRVFYGASSFDILPGVFRTHLREIDSSASAEVREVQRLIQIDQQRLRLFESQPGSLQPQTSVNTFEAPPEEHRIPIHQRPQMEAWAQSRGESFFLSHTNYGFFTQQATNAFVYRHPELSDNIPEYLRRLSERVTRLIGTPLLQTGWQTPILQEYLQEQERRVRRLAWIETQKERLETQLIQRAHDYGIHSRPWYASVRYETARAWHRLSPDEKTVMRGLENRYLSVRELWLPAFDEVTESDFDVHVLQATPDRLIGSPADLVDWRRILIAYFSSISSANRSAEDAQNLAQLQSPGGTLLIGTPAMLSRWRSLILLYYQTNLADHQLQFAQAEARELARMRQVYAEQLKSVTDETLDLTRNARSILTRTKHELFRQYIPCLLVALVVTNVCVFGFRKKKKEIDVSD